MKIEVEGLKYNYEGYHGCDSHCFISIYRSDEYVAVVATESDDNMGASITNMIENIATFVCREYQIDMEKLIWVEHYPREQDHTRAPSWDLAFFTIAESPVRGFWNEPKGNKVLIRPRWFPIDIEMKEKIISGDPSFMEHVKTQIEWQHAHLGSDLDKDLQSIKNRCGG